MYVGLLHKFKNIHKHSKVTVFVLTLEAETWPRPEMYMNDSPLEVVSFTSHRIPAGEVNSSFQNLEIGNRGK